MRATGLLLIILGLLAVGFGFNANVAVDAPGMVASDPRLQSGLVANTDLMSQRESIILVGCTAFLAGIILVAAKALLDAIAPPRPKVAAD